MLEKNLVLMAFLSKSLPGQAAKALNVICED